MNKYFCPLCFNKMNKSLNHIYNKYDYYCSANCEIAYEPWNNMWYYFSENNEQRNNELKEYADKVYKIKGLI